ncbi:MAG: hypothetical protein U0L88_06525, partial [Acutalibacteraceae bacterium]|nr:hypothetical protein [Acutalibacteraceae bacterium]
IVAKAETRRADSCLAKNSLDYITILVFTQNQGHTRRCYNLIRATYKTELPKSLILCGFCRFFCCACFFIATML